MFFCGINFNQKNKHQLFERHGNNKLKIIITANASFIVESHHSRRFLDILNSNYVTFDGTVPYLLAKLLSRVTSNKLNKLGGMLNNFDFEKLSGADIIYDFCKYARENNLRLFLLGGKKENNEMSVKIIKEKYHVEVDGFSPAFENYPFSDNFNESCIGKIKHFKPEILFVGFGVPKQEYWIDDNKNCLSEIGVLYAIGCGGTFDFVSGNIKRAPLFIQEIGLEGVYRFFQEPGKARFKRLVDSLKFLKYLNK